MRGADTLIPGYLMCCMLKVPCYTGAGTVPVGTIIARLDRGATVHTYIPHLGPRTLPAQSRLALPLSDPEFPS